MASRTTWYSILLFQKSVESQFFRFDENRKIDVESPSLLFKTLSKRLASFLFSKHEIKKSTNQNRDNFTQISIQREILLTKNTTRLGLFNNYTPIALFCRRTSRKLLSKFDERPVRQQSKPRVEADPSSWLLLYDWRRVGTDVSALSVAKHSRIPASMRIIGF